MGDNAVEKELERIDDEHAYVNIAVRPKELLPVMAAVQRSLMHPETKPRERDICEHFVIKTSEALRKQGFAEISNAIDEGFPRGFGGKI